MRTWYCFLFLLLVSSAAAFTTKKIDPRTRPHPAFKTSATVAKEPKDDATPAPVPGPAFARTNTAASMAPAVYHEDDEDDDELIGYGTALVSCVISLALGFTLGYGT